jgi:predicted transcriptional regulator
MAGTSGSRKMAQGRKPAAKGKRSKRKVDNRDADLISALNHALRRDILRLMHASGEARSPVGISEQLGRPLASVSYHVQILHRLGAVSLEQTEQVRGALKHFYASTVKDHRIARSLLESTRKSDEARGRSK